MARKLSEKGTGFKAKVALKAPEKRAHAGFLLTSAWIYLAYTRSATQGERSPTLF